MQGYCDSSESQYPFFIHFHQLGCDFLKLNTAFLETIVYIWGNEHLSYSE